jgi:hypothetical protein
MQWLFLPYGANRPRDKAESADDAKIECSTAVFSALPPCFRRAHPPSAEPHPQIVKQLRVDGLPCSRKMWGIEHSKISGIDVHERRQIRQEPDRSAEILRACRPILPSIPLKSQ